MDNTLGKVDDIYYFDWVYNKDTKQVEKADTMSNSATYATSSTNMNFSDSNKSINSNNYYDYYNGLVNPTLEGGWGWSSNPPNISVGGYPIGSVEVTQTSAPMELIDKHLIRSKLVEVNEKIDELLKDLKSAIENRETELIKQIDRTLQVHYGMAKAYQTLIDNPY